MHSLYLDTVIQKPTISDKTEDSMKLTRKQGNTTEIYTYNRK